MHIAERSYHYMSRTNTLLDSTLCDVLVEINDLTYFKTFDLVNSEKIFKIGYDYSREAILKSIDLGTFSLFPTIGFGSQKGLLP